MRVASWVPVAALAAGLIAPPAAAQSTQATSGEVPAAQASDDGTIHDIVVTAQRREESAQRAAISIDTLGGQQLERGGITNPEQLTQAVPALQAQPASGPYLNFSIRGVSNFGVNSFADGAVVLSFDGVPQVHPVSGTGLFYDLARVEVLKGPQGTLYGRNATGGAVNVIARTPEWTIGGNASVEVGNYARKVFDAAVNVPLADQLAARLAFQRSVHDGYYSDGSGDEDSLAARLSLRFEPVPAVRLLVVADYNKNEGLGTGSSLLTSRATPPLGASTGVTVPVVGPFVGLLDPRVQGQFTGVGVAARNFLPFQDNRYWGVLLQAEVDTPAGTLTLLPSYRKNDLLYLSAVPTFYTAEQLSSRQYSLEARLTSDDARRLRYIAGIYYLDDQIAGQSAVEVPPSLTNQFPSNATRSIAGFGQLTFRLTDTFRLVGGARYTSELKTTDSTRYRVAPFAFATTPLYPFPPRSAGVLNLTLTERRRFNDATWRAGVEWDVARDSLAYANVSTGFKAGGFFFGPPDRDSYRPERVTAYTLGSKNRFLGRRVQLNAEGFYLDYRDQQISYFGFTSAGTSFITDNVGQAHIYGIESDLEVAVTPTTRVTVHGQWEEAKYDRFTYVSSNPLANTQTCPVTTLPGGAGYQLDCSGRRVLQVPRWLVSGGIEQRVPLPGGATLIGSVDSRWESSRETSLNYLVEARAPGYTRTDLALTWESPARTFSATAYVHNVENNAVIVFTQAGRTFTVSNGGLLDATYQPPRTYGFRFGFRY